MVTISRFMAFKPICSYNLVLAESRMKNSELLFAGLLALALVLLLVALGSTQSLTQRKNGQNLLGSRFSLGFDPRSAIDLQGANAQQQFLAIGKELDRGSQQWRSDSTGISSWDRTSRYRKRTRGELSSPELRSPRLRTHNLPSADL